MSPDFELPNPSDNRVAVHPTRSALRQLRRGHPWLWDGSIDRISGEGKPGDLAVVFDESRQFAAIGLFDPASPIRVRVLHIGPPTPIDDGFFASRLVDAVDRRQPLLDDGATTGYRLVHGENDRLPGLVIDWYEGSAVVRIDTAAWLPHLQRILDPFIELTQPTRVVFRCSRRIAHDLTSGIHDGAVLHGPAPKTAVRFLEHGLEFEADLIHGQKTGHFLDQRDNRRLISTRTRDADVLDVFCNTGGFTVHAAAGGARRVHSVDISRHAITAVERHLELNRAVHGFTATHRTSTGDAFEVMEHLVSDGARFDVVIVDPPSFAPNERSVPAARRAYQRLTGLSIELLGAGGTLFQASCSSRIDDIDFHDLIAEELEIKGWKATDVIRTRHPIDHPIGFEHGSYLKAVLADVRPR